VPAIEVIARRKNTAAELVPAVDVTIITSPDDPKLVDFYTAYDLAFILEDEKETFEGFQACLSLNEGPEYKRLSALYTPYREMVLLLTEGRHGDVVGGANFIAFAHTGEDGKPFLTVSLSYIFIARAHRRRRLFSHLVARVGEEAVAAFRWPDGKAPDDMLVFLEMNDPLRMPSEDYARDSEHAGLDQIDRMRIWHRMGARLLDVTYVQPPLSDAQAPNDALLMAVLGANKPALPACLLAKHMRCFFGVTVLKGSDPMKNASARAQLDVLDAACAKGVPIALKRIDELAARLNAERMKG
jgi:hypothetical protein